VAEASGWHAIYGVLVGVLLALLACITLLLVITRHSQVRNL
jgi:hypothetical protein